VKVEEKYRRKVLRLRRRQEIAMKSAFIRVSKEFAEKFANVPIIRTQESFQFKTNSKLNKDLTELIGRFETELYENISGGMKNAWGVGNEMNDEYVTYYFAGIEGFKAQQKAMMARNTEAMNAFISRKRNARTLSDRVWKTANRFRDELEANLLIGVSEGKSAADIAEQVKTYLERPDDLFRKVRDPKGDLRLSNAAKKLNPGSGVYRSSFKNAFRMSRTEINAAYRRADNLRWQSQDFIFGYRVTLSAQHPRYDICDELQGKYPKSFVFTGWHPQCFCNVTPIRMQKDDFVRRLHGERVNVSPMEEMPGNFKRWMSDNASRVRKMKNKPYFILDNKSVIRSKAGVNVS
jgi:hypothetical protein